MNMSVHSRRGRSRNGFLTTSTLGALCLGMLATSMTTKEIMFHARTLNTELANEVRPAAGVEPGQAAGEQVAELPVELKGSLANR